MMMSIKIMRMIEDQDHGCDYDDDDDEGDQDNDDDDNDGKRRASKQDGMRCYRGHE